MEATRFFENLEGRALLSAPVATVQSFAVAPNTLHVVVSYSSDSGIDPASISRLNLGLTGPGLSRQAESATIVSQGPTETVARYVIRFSLPFNDPRAPWPNGTYNLGIPAGTVRSTDGFGIADTGAGSYWLWFPDNYLQVTRFWVGTADIHVDVRYWTRAPYGQEEALAVSVRLTAPDGTQRVRSLMMGPSGVFDTSFYFLNADDRPWDYTDPDGTYTADIGLFDGTQYNYHPAGQTWLWFTSPKVEILSTDVTDAAARIVVRVSDDHAIDMTSFAGTNIGVGVWNGSEAVDIPPSLDDGRYVSAPVLEPQADGSVIATYWRAMYLRGFTNRESGDWSYYTTSAGVRDVDGNGAVPGPLRRHETHVFTTISTWSVGLTAHADDPTYLMLSVQFVTANLDTRTLGDGDLRLELNGHTYALTLAYGGYNGHFYTLQLPVGERLDTGTGRFYLNAGAVTTSGLPNAETFLGQFWFWFN